MAKPMDAIALLKADHRKVEKLFEQFEKSKNALTKKKLADAICLELVVHTRIEEEIFYPACSGEVEEDTMDEAHVEHDGAKVLIAEIRDASPDAGYFDAKVKVLSEMIKHHVKEEERPSDGMFAQARNAGLDMDELGEQLKTRKEELTADYESSGTPLPETHTLERATLS